MAGLPSRQVRPCFVGLLLLAFACDVLLASWLCLVLIFFYFTSIFVVVFPENNALGFEHTINTTAIYTLCDNNRSNDAESWAENTQIGVCVCVCACSSHLLFSYIRISPPFPPVQEIHTVTCTQVLLHAVKKCTPVSVQRARCCCKKKNGRTQVLWWLFALARCCFRFGKNVYENPKRISVVFGFRCRPYFPVLIGVALCALRPTGCPGRSIEAVCRLWDRIESEVSHSYKTSKSVKRAR